MKHCNWLYLLMLLAGLACADPPSGPVPPVPTTPTGPRPPQFAPPQPALILGLNNASRVPNNRYIVTLRESLPWKRLRSKQLAPTTDPAVRAADISAMQAADAADDQMVQQIAQELAATYGGTVGARLIHGFVITMNESQVKLMAQDQRIQSIGADQYMCDIMSHGGCKP